MSKITIYESEMCFGEYDAKDVFQIEKCTQYVSSLKSSGIKICEFILLHRDKLLILEAKKNCLCRYISKKVERRNENL